MEHSKPVYKNRPEWYDQYYKTEVTQDGEPLYRKERKLFENNLVAYCGVCGKRLCSRFTNFCPACGAKVDEQSEMEGKKTDYKELIEQLHGLLPPKVDYAEMVGAEAVHYGKSFVYESPESYLIEAAANAIEILLVELDEYKNRNCNNCKYK